MSLWLGAVLLILPAIHATAQEGDDRHAELAGEMAEPDPAVRRKTAEVLRRKNAYYEEDALINQTKKGEVFTYARIEVTGVMSNDDTSLYDDQLVEASIKPSYSAEDDSGVAMPAPESAPPASPAFERLRGFLKKIVPGNGAQLPTVIAAKVALATPDVEEFAQAAAGITTPRARRKLNPYGDSEINELIAHSWGCELVYAAILNGDIRPPKRLLLVGVPDDDRKKWDLLAKYTGTEVIWARADNDAVAIDMGVKLASYSAAKVDFKAQWEAFCAGKTPSKKTCHPHKRKPNKVFKLMVGNIPGVDGHARTEYYDKLKAFGFLTESCNRLRTLEYAKVEDETRRLRSKALEDAHREALEIIEQERTMAEQYRLMQKENMAMQPFSEEFGRRMTELKNLGKPSRLDPSSVVMPTAQPPQPFLVIFPRLTEFAASACRAPNQLEVRLYFYNIYDVSRREYDDEMVRSISAGLEVCARRLFYTIIERTRVNEGFLIVDGQWAANTMARNAQLPDYPGGNAVPYSGGGRRNEGTPTAPPPAAVHDPEGEALRQLKAIEEDNAMRKRWGLPPKR